jgi:NADH-quinone oxidoreductase subunit M
MGIYGYIRFLVISPIAIEGCRSVIITIAIIGVLYTAMLCITAAMDIKKIIAYSSISHMNLAILALFSGSNLGEEIAVYFMISHGILSSGLFLLVGILYDRYHTRIISYYKG